MLRGSRLKGHPHEKWNRRHEFKSWTKLFPFHFALMPLGKAWIHLFSLNCGHIGFSSLGKANNQKEEKSWIQTASELSLCHILPEAEGLGRYIHKTTSMEWPHYSSNSLQLILRQSSIKYLLCLVLFYTTVAYWPLTEPSLHETHLYK